LESSVEGKIWILFEDRLYFYRVKNNWNTKKTQVFLQRYDIVKKQLDIVYMGDEFGAEEFPVFGRAEEVATVFGVKMMLF